MSYLCLRSVCVCDSEAGKTPAISCKHRKMPSRHICPVDALNSGLDFSGRESLMHCNLRKHTQLQETQQQIRRRSSSVWQEARCKISQRKQIKIHTASAHNTCKQHRTQRKCVEGTQKCDPAGICLPCYDYWSCDLWKMTCLVDLSILIPAFPGLLYIINLNNLNLNGRVGYIFDPLNICTVFPATCMCSD